MISIKKKKSLIYIITFMIILSLVCIPAFADDSMEILKFTSNRECVTAINSVPGYWEIVEHGKVCWVDAGPTEYVGQSSTFPMTLRMTAVRPVFISPIIYSYGYGEEFEAIGSVSGWWKVQTPNGIGWVNAGPTSYVGQSSTFPMLLLSTSSYLPVYSAYPGSFGQII